MSPAAGSPPAVTSRYTHTPASGPHRHDWTRSDRSSDVLLAPPLDSQGRPNLPRLGCLALLPQPRGDGADHPRPLLPHCCLSPAYAIGPHLPRYALPRSRAACGSTCSGDRGVHVRWERRLSRTSVGWPAS